MANFTDQEPHKMKRVNYYITTMLLLLSTACLFAQDGGRFSGGFQSNGNIYLRDSLIGADNIPQYDYQLFGADAWLDLGYSNYGFNMGIRIDMFSNSNLLNPNASYTDQGIGKWYVGKSIGKLGLLVGYIYDQIGSGIIFRSYEQRPQLIDNALVGARATYDLSENWQLKGMVGQQKILFSRYPSIIKAASLDGFLTFGAEDNISMAPGIGYMTRTLDDSEMTNLVNAIVPYIEEDRVKPVYNVHTVSLFNTLSAGPISWYVEGAYKSEEVYQDPNAIRTSFTGVQTLGKLVSNPGSTVYSSISYAGHGLGVTLEGKRTENFNIRTESTLSLNNGLIGFLPPMNKQNTYRLTTRYQPATQDLTEYAMQGDVLYRINKAMNVSANVSAINDLDGKLLYRELYTDFLYKHKRLWQLTGGLQIQKYNQGVYETKPNVPLVETVVPFVDFLYKISRKKSVRTELQYMITGDDNKAGSKQDFGDWLFAQVELAFAPHWAFTVSDMYNTSPGKNSPKDENGNKIALHFPRVDVFYTRDANRFSLSYVKQVEGIVCTGGICRLEPAFSGIKFSIDSTF